MTRLSLRWLAAVLAAGALAVGCGNSTVTPNPDMGGPQPDQVGPTPDDGNPQPDRVNPQPDEGPDMGGPDEGGPDVPPPPDMPPPPPLMVGTACADDADCGDGGFCFTEVDNGLPGGYCSGACASDADCGANAGCVDTGQGSICISTCADDNACRTGYICEPNLFGLAVPGSNVCTPGTPGTPGAAAGDACTADMECPRAGFCITEENGDFPAGYCATACDPAAATTGCADGAVCVDTGDGGGLCAAGCTDDTDCRAADGYACVLNLVGLSSGTDTVCAPGSATPVAAGAACEDHGDCTAGNGFCLGGSPGGYCTSSCDPAAATSECGVAEACADSGDGTGLCAAVCTQDSDCRNGGTDYICEPAFFGRFDVPGDTKVCTAGSAGTQGAVIGGACTADAMCTRAGICLTEAEQQFPGGYCSLFCDPTATESGCGAGNSCFPIDQNDPTAGLCVDGCTTDTDCTRAGYTCQPIDQAGTTLACFPAQ